MMLNQTTSPIPSKKKEVEDGISSSVSVFIDVDKLLIAFYWFHKYVINNGMTRSRYVVEENTWVAYLFVSSREDDQW